MVCQGPLARDPVEALRLHHRVAVGGRVREPPIVGDREQDVRGVVLSRGGSPGRRGESCCRDEPSKQGVG